MGKGDKKRPCLISAEENDLRWRLALELGLTLEDRAEILTRIHVLESERNRHGRATTQ